MKIVHICLAAVYIEGFGYQENILPQCHRAMGYDVTVLTSDHVFDKNYTQKIREENDYVNPYGVHVIALQRTKRYGPYSKFGDYADLFKTLKKERPDIIFVHGGQFVALMDVIAYCKRNSQVKLYIDQHGDYYNMRLDRWQNRFVQHWIYGHWMRKAIPYVNKFWGVTPWRCQYLNDVYKIPKEKIDLLVMGGDDTYIHFKMQEQIRKQIREELDLGQEDFVLISGGKIDSKKNIHVLINVVEEMNRNNLKLIVFGQPDKDMKALIEDMSRDSHVRYIGWLDSTKVYDYFLASDLAVFPGTHSVLWEQACSCGLPGIFKDWVGMRHVDLGGNARFVRGDDKEELKTVISEILDSTVEYEKMREVARNKAIPYFSYARIARRAIELE